MDLSVGTNAFAHCGGVPGRRAKAIDDRPQPRVSGIRTRCDGQTGHGGHPIAFPSDSNAIVSYDSHRNEHKNGQPANVLRFAVVVVIIVVCAAILLACPGGRRQPAIGIKLEAPGSAIPFHRIDLVRGAVLASTAHGPKPIVRHSGAQSMERIGYFNRAQQKLKRRSHQTRNLDCRGIRMWTEYFRKCKAFREAFLETLQTRTGIFEWVLANGGRMEGP